MHVGKWDASGRAALESNRRTVLVTARHHRELPAYIGGNGRYRYFGQARLPIAFRVDAVHGSTPPAMTTLIAD